MAGCTRRQVDGVSRYGMIAFRRAEPNAFNLPPASSSRIIGLTSAASYHGPVRPAMAQLDKGKGKEEEAWNPGWWQFSSLSEPQTCVVIRPHREGYRMKYHYRPIIWTKHSTILMGHPTQPSVYGRVFPSSRPFIVPSPALVLSGTYGPPTNLSLSPDDKFLFAFFPPMQGPSGVACLWAREQADTWNVKESWLSTGCVTVAWLGGQREVRGALKHHRLMSNCNYNLVGSWCQWSFASTSPRPTGTSLVCDGCCGVSGYATTRLLS